MIPLRPLFIASLGNPKPYYQTRHSAGHILLDAIRPLLAARFPPSSSSSPYELWRSPALMNVSGPKLVRQLSAWMSSARTAAAIDPSHPPLRNYFRPILVLLHDELEAPLGRVKVRRGGPEKASLRGHRGLVSVMQSLRGKGLYPPSASTGPGRLSIMRVGVGIGRPSSRGSPDVADYVLTEMDQVELAAVRAAAGPVVDLLVAEVYRVDEVD